MRGPRSRLTSIALAVALAGCAGNNPRLWAYDKQTEVDTGSKADKQIVKRLRVTGKQDLSEYVSTVGRKVAAASDRNDLQWTFTALDSFVPYAFSTQGGYVYVTNGMLALLGSEGELAAVLAHEIAHICARDTLRAQAEDNVVFLGRQAVDKLGPEGILLLPVFAVIGVGRLLQDRRSEVRADRHGAGYLLRAGYSSEDMSSVLETLARLEVYRRDHAGVASDGWSIFSSHPATEERQRALGRSQRWPQAIQDREFLARLDGLELTLTKLSETEDRANPMVLRVREVRESDTFASLAKTARIPNAEATLRLLNQRYPSGEPEVGELVKVIE